MGGNIRRKSAAKPAKKIAKKKTARKAARTSPIRRAVASVTPKAWDTSAPLRPDRLTSGPRKDLDLPVPAAKDKPVRPVDVTRHGWSEKTVPRPVKG